jgi:hypothetical protein
MRFETLDQVEPSQRADASDRDAARRRELAAGVERRSVAVVWTTRAWTPPFMPPRPMTSACRPSARSGPSGHVAGAGEAAADVERRAAAVVDAARALTVRSFPALMPLPSADQLVPFHFAMRLAVPPPRRPPS